MGTGASDYGGRRAGRVRERNQTKQGWVREVKVNWGQGVRKVGGRDETCVEEWLG